MLDLVGLDPDTYRDRYPAPALRRPAAARRRGAGAGRGPAGAADGRAVRRGRPDHPRPAAGRAAAAAARAGQDDRLRHPRLRRGGQARRPDRRAGQPVAHRAVRHPGGDPGQPGQRHGRRVRRRRRLPQAADAQPGRATIELDQRPHRRTRTTASAEMRRALRARKLQWGLVLDQRDRPLRWVSPAQLATRGFAARRRDPVGETCPCSRPCRTRSKRCSPKAARPRSSPDSTGEYVGLITIDTLVDHLAATDRHRHDDDHATRPRSNPTMSRGGAARDPDEPAIAERGGPHRTSSRFPHVRSSTCRRDRCSRHHRRAEYIRLLAQPVIVLILAVGVLVWAFRRDLTATQQASISVSNVAQVTWQHVLITAAVVLIVVAVAVPLGTLLTRHRIHPSGAVFRRHRQYRSRRAGDRADRAVLPGHPHHRVLGRVSRRSRSIRCCRCCATRSSATSRSIPH